MTLLETLPIEIAQSDRAVVWNRETRDGKPTKVPYNPRRPADRARVDDPSTWAPFAEAVAAVEDGKCDGPGVVLGAGLIGVDLDACRDPNTRVIAPEARAIVDALNSYTEISPSGRGVHILATGTLPPGRRRHGRIEMYADGRFFTVTGHHLVGTPTTIEERTAALAALHARVFTVEAPTDRLRPMPTIDDDDATLIARMHAARTGYKFSTLWAGDVSGYPSASEADLALCATLAFWTGREANRMDRLFRQSGLMRAKWDTRHGRDTYGHLTIDRAIAGCRDTYQGTPPPPIVDAPAAVSPSPRTLAETHAKFARWLGAKYDSKALDAVLAAAAAERLPGDPLWLLVISGSGNAKTETVQALAGAGAIVTSTISSEGALLSASARKERAKDATGGLLRRLGARGVLVIKDVTSILAMNRDARASLLAALREIHDGRWERNVGVDGGRSMLWTGRIVVIGAVTTAWDRAHDVVASMGDRFVIVRMDSTTGRLQAGRQACKNVGDERRMRDELAAVVTELLAAMTRRPTSLTAAEHKRILRVANVVTLARTGVDYDYRGDVIDAHAPEMPTRFAKQLTQLVRGAIALGMPRAEALKLAVRCARDSMPPLRLAILDDVAEYPQSQTKEVRRRLCKPRSTVDRQLQALQMLGVLVCDEEDAWQQGKQVTLWKYRLARGISPKVLDPEI